MKKLRILTFVIVTLLTVVPSVNAQILGKLKGNAKSKLAEKKKKASPLRKVDENFKYTSDFHKSNVGNILFSNRPIVIGNEDPAQFKTEFSINEKIYAMAYLRGTIKDLFKAGGRYNMEMGPENRDVKGFSFNPDDLEKSYYHIEILPDPKEAVHSIDCEAFYTLFYNASKGKNTLKFDLAAGANENKTAVMGEIEIDMTGADLDKLWANVKKAQANAADNKARKRKLPEGFSNPTNKFSDPELSSENLKKLLVTEWGNCAEILKLGTFYIYKSGSGDWSLHKNEYGTPTHKANNRKISVVYKGKDGWCYYVDEVFFIKEYEDNGKYLKVRYSHNTDPVKIGCKNVK